MVAAVSNNYYDVRAAVTGHRIVTRIRLVAAPFIKRVVNRLATGAGSETISIARLEKTTASRRQLGTLIRFWNGSSISPLSFRGLGDHCFTLFFQILAREGFGFEFGLWIGLLENGGLF